MNLNCVIVEDDPMFRVMVKRLVAQDDQRLNLVGLAESAEEARSFFDQHDIDLLFLDLGLPGMDGFEFLKTLDNTEDLQVILITAHEEHALDAYEHGIVDYLVKPISEERFKKAVEKAIRNLPYSRSDSPENTIFQKVAQFMHSRNIDSLEPVPLRSAKLGYAYPMLTANYDFQLEHRGFDTIERAEQEGLLTGEFVDSFYVCNNCYNSHLHYRESCPSCESTHLDSENLVHHFSCAYMGPISDFYANKSRRDNNNMVCPKCEKTLNHIGVDYDKPSDIYTCHKCDHTFQNPEIKAKCHNCGSENRVEHLIKKELKKYELTQAGKQAASGKFSADLQNDDVLEDVMDESYFIRFFNKEIERLKKRDGNSFIAEMQFNNIAELYKKIGDKRTNNLVRELYRIIQMEIEGTDEAVFRNKVSVLLMITEKKAEGAEELLEHIKSKLIELIQDNFSGFHTDIHFRKQEIQTNISAENQLERFLSA